MAIGMISTSIKFSSFVMRIFLPGYGATPDKGNTAVYTFGQFTLNFQTEDTTSHLSLVGVNGTGPARIYVEKERIGVFNWNERPYFENPTTELNYTLNSFTVWSTQSTGIPDPGDSKLADSWYKWNLTTKINSSTFWPSTGNIEREFVTMDANLIPFVWGTANFTLSPDMYHFHTNSTNETYIYYEKIMLVAGYFLRATKNITIFQDTVYKVQLNVSNLGNRMTPELVIVADLIPKEFNITYMDLMNITSTNATKGYATEGSIEGIMWQRWGSMYNFTNNVSASGDFSNDMIYYWNLTRVHPDESIEIEYYLNGTGSAFSLLDAYIIGIDPIKVSGYHASPALKIAEGIIAETREFIIVGVVALLGFGTLIRSKKVR